MSKYHRWTDEENEYLREACAVVGSQTELVDKFNARFGLSLSEQSILSHYLNHGMRLPNATKRRYNKQEREYIRSNSGKLTLNEMVEGIYKLTGKQTCLGSVGNYVNQTLKSKPGQLNKLPIGGEIVKKSDGYTYVKIADAPQGGGRNWKAKQIIEYERLHNVIVKREQHVCFLNQNKRDFSKENLYLITNRIHIIMSKNQWYSNNREITLTAIRWCELLYAITDITKEG